MIKGTGCFTERQVLFSRMLLYVCVWLFHFLGKKLSKEYLSKTACLVGIETINVFHFILEYDERNSDIMI